MNILELEALAEMADRRELDLAELLRRKCDQPSIRFDMFLAQRYGGEIPLDQQLWGKAKAILERVESNLLNQSQAASP